MKLTSEARFTPTDTLYPHETTLIIRFLKIMDMDTPIITPHPVLSWDATLQKADEEEMENKTCDEKLKQFRQIT